MFPPTLGHNRWECFSFACQAHPVRVSSITGPRSGSTSDPMHYTPRTIAFLAELLHPPMVADPAPIQRIHNLLFQSSRPDYASFTVGPEGAVLSNPPNAPGAVSSATFLGDRVQFREESTGLSLEDFTERMVRIVQLIIQEKQPQIFTGLAITVRTLVNPKQFVDSRSFIKSGVCGFSNQQMNFGREPQLFGLRLVFPPTPEEPQAFALRIESFANDARSVFIENQGTFGPSMIQNASEDIAAKIQATYSFLTERSLGFLAQFDQREMDS
jgi:hypothetical protein